MKKYLSLVLCAVLLLTLMPNVAAAGTGNAFAIVCEDVTCTPGEQTKVAVNVVNNPGFMYLSVTLTYPEELTLVDVTNGELIADLTKGNQYIWVADADVTADGLLMTLTFDVAADASVGEYSVGVDVKQCANYDEQEVTVAEQNATVTVEEASMTIVCEDVSCEPGEEVTVKVSVADNPGFMYLSATLTYPEELTLTNVTNGELIADLTKGNQYIWVADANVTTDGLLMTLTFQVAEDVPVGEYSVGVDVKQCANYDEQEVKCTVDNGKVTVAKAAPTAIDQFTYELNGTEMTITGYVGDAAKVLIGSTYEIGGTEYTVTAIADEAFVENEVIESVVIPGTVKSIGEYAFGYCVNLTAVTLNEGLQVIGVSAFDGCALTEVVVPTTVTSIGDYAFYDNVDMTGATVLNKDAEIGECAIGYYLYRKKDVLIVGFVLTGHTNSTAHNYAAEEGINFSELLKIAAASISLQHNLAVNYKVDKILFEKYGYETPAISVQMNGETVVLNEYTVAGNSYVFSFRNIAPNQMNDTITATLKATLDGEEYVCDGRDYSIAVYCYSMLEECSADEYAELRTLLVDLLHYGAASQTYANYKTDALANADLTAEQLAWGTAAEPALDTVLNTTYKTVANPTAKWKGASLNLKESVAMRLMFTAENIEGLSVKIESGDDVWTIPASQFVANDGEYAVYFNGLHAGQMRQSVYLTVYNGETAVSNTARYSIESYAYEKQNSTNTGLAELVEAMMKYGDSAYAYAN